MNNFIKDTIRKVLYPNKYSSEAYVNFLRRGGAKIGEDCVFYAPTKTLIDETSLMFIEMGDNVQVTSGVIILAHDYSYSVCGKNMGALPRKQRVTHIGHNVFIGMNSIVLMGAYVGDNVIIGAGSVVTGHCDDNSVYAGNPAKKICTLQEYCERGENQIVDSARCHARQFFALHNRYPEISEMGFYTSLFVDKTDENMNKYFANAKDPELIRKIAKRFDSVLELMEGND